MPPDLAPDLAGAQAAMAATIMHGPAACPPDLFAGGGLALWRGLKVHANTISHARLVALEETFPRTRALLGEGEFNRLARAFLDAGEGALAPLARIGAHFPAWLAPGLPARLAGVEWLWLEAFNAGDAAPLRIEDLAGLSEAGVLALRAARHPAARFCALDPDLGAMLGLAGDEPWLALLRPDADVCALALPAAAYALAQSCDGAQSLGAAIETFCALHPNSDASAMLLLLIGGGALIRESDQ